MSKSGSSSSSSGIGFTGLLLILFIGLKLGGILTWSWWWIMSPIWISVLLTLSIFGIILTLAIIGEWLTRRKIKARRAKLEQLPSLSESHKAEVNSLAAAEELIEQLTRRPPTSRHFPN